jgi:hypothetical protein
MKNPPKETGQLYPDGDKRNDANNNLSSTNNGFSTTDKKHVRCAFFNRNLHSRMSLVPTPAHLKRAYV